jgi:hypothetical protein
MKKIITLGVVLCALLPFNAGAQFVLNGNATVTSPECSDSTTTYQLTPDLNTQAGEIWYTTQVSLSNRFDIQFQMYLGSKAYSVGADGICFVFQQQSVNAGSSGGGMGYGGITPSLAVEFDTYHNSWDPTFCHTAIEKNGDVEHTDNSGNNLAGPVQLDPANPNLPDGNWHNMEVIWDPGLQTLSVYYDCIFRVAYTGDVVDSIFGGNPNVYWGFTGGTGGSDNQQEVCVGNSYLNNLRDTTVCAGNSVTLTAKGGASYSWSPGTGLNIDTGGTVIATPKVTTTYTVSIKNACGIISTDSTTVTVNPQPTVVMGAPFNILCGGASTGSATVIASGGTTPYTYTWMPSGGSNATASDLSAGTYTVIVNDANGCTGTSGIATVTITQPVPLTDSLVVSNTISCNSSTGSASIYVTGGTGAYTYLWSPGGGTTSSETGLTNGTYTVTVTDATGCTASPAAIFTINQPEKLIISIASRTTLACQEYGYITAHAATGGVPPYIYSWTPSGGTNLTTISTLSAGSYTITVTDSNGCTATASYAMIYPPHLGATSSLVQGLTCEDGKNGIVTSTATGGIAPYSYSWYPSGGTNATESGLSAGTYTVTVTDSSGCTASAAVTITDPTGMTITNYSTPQSGPCNGLASVAVSGGAAPYTYSWNPGGETTDTIKGQCAGVYCCTITDHNGCSQSVCLNIEYTSGVDNIDPGSGGIVVYPNPNNGVFTIQISDISNPSAVEIYNVLGQNIMKEMLSNTENKNVINLRDKSAGVYFYRVVTEDGHLLGEGKLLIQK